MPRKRLALEEAFALSLAVLLSFAALARGAHDIWAATLAYLLVLALASVFLVASSWPAGSRGVHAGFLPALGILAAVYTLSFFLAVHPADSFLRWMDWLSALTLFWIALHVLRADHALDVFLAGMVPVLCVEAALILYQQCVGSFFCEQPGGSLVNSNIAAAFLILWTAPLADRVRRTWNTGDPLRPVWAAGLAADLIGIIFIYSTWAVVCLGVGLPLLASRRTIVRWVETHRKAAAAAGAFLVFILLIVAHKFTRAFGLDGAALHPGENTRRFGWWWSACRMFLDRPAFGVGLGNFPSAYLAYQAGGQHTRFAHSFPLTVLAETGLIGALGLLSFFTVWLRRTLRDKALTRRLPLSVGLAMFLLFSLISLSVEYWVNLAAFCVLSAAVAAPAAAERARPRRSLLIVLPLAALCAVPGLLTPFLSSRACVYAEERLRDGDGDSALKAYAGAAALDPRSSAAQRGLALAHYARYLSSGENAAVERAMDHQWKAVRLDLLNGVLWWELSRYLRARGDAGGSLRYLRYAARLNRGHPGIRRDLEALKDAREP